MTAPVVRSAPVWFDGQIGTGSGDQIVIHGDVGPWNLVWRDGELVGLIDWEYATIGSPRERWPVST